MTLREQCENALQKKAERIRQEIARAEEENLKDALRIAQEYSSGPYKQIQLTAMGHPFAKRHRGRPPVRLPLDIINLQSGEFERAWQTILGIWQSGRLVSYLKNRNRVAILLQEGTDLMVSRPILRTIARLLQPIRVTRLKEAVRRGLR